MDTIRQLGYWCAFLMLICGCVVAYPFDWLYRKAVGLDGETWEKNVHWWDV